MLATVRNTIKQTWDNLETEITAQTFKAVAVYLDLLFSCFNKSIFFDSTILLKKFTFQFLEKV